MTHGKDGRIRLMGLMVSLFGSKEHARPQVQGILHIGHELISVKHMGDQAFVVGKGMRPKVGDTLKIPRRHPAVGKATAEVTQLRDGMDDTWRAYVRMR